VRLLWSSVTDDGPARQIELRLRSDLQVPDLLAYWVDDRPPQAPGGGSLPENARLLGSVAGAGTYRFSLPESASHPSGTVLLYSLARNEVVAGSSLGGTPS
jgi:hypothetical protein